MKQTFKTYRAVAAMLAAILLLAVGVTYLSGGFSRGSTKSTAVLATTYPVYVAAQNVLGGDASVTLTRLDGAASGCLHDYQLSPADRRLTQEAELILLNGAGAEPFLDGLVEESKCVDTSAGIDLLCADHDHDHAESEHHEEEQNEHFWLSPTRYAKQVEAVRDALCALVPEKAEAYRQNAAAYLAQIAAVGEALPDLSGRPCVLFHDSMSYLAADLGLEVTLTLSVEGESGLSAADLKQVEALAAQYPDLLLLYDTQYALRYEGVAGIPVTIRTAVQEDWLTAMKANVKALQEVAD